MSIPNSRSIRRTALAAILLSSVCYAQAAFAQTNGTAAQSPVADSDEIIVTAQKREQSVQDIPIAITALSSALLQKEGVANVVGLSNLVPNTRANAFAGSLVFVIRGVGSTLLGSGIDSGTAVHEDGVYIARPKAQVASFFDIDRVEVLRGPQGTLYGRNATGGVVNLVTKQPTNEFDANGSVQYGNYNSVNLEAGIGGPVIEDVLSVRVAGVLRTHDGFGRNVVTGTRIDDQHEWGLRGTVRLGNAQASYTVMAEYFKRDDKGAGFHLFGPARVGTPLVGVARGFTTATRLRDLASEVDPKNQLRSFALTGTGDVELSDSVSVRSISAYRNSQTFRVTDIDHTALPVPFATTDGAKQWSQEFQLLADIGAHQIVLGAYYLREDISSFTDIPLLSIVPVPGFHLLQAGTGRVSALGVFLNDEWNITDKLTLNAGIRYSHEKRSHISQSAFGTVTTATTGETSWNAFTPKVALSYEINDDISVYASVGKGFKAGAYILGTTNPVVNPETVWAYEGGLKAQLFDRRLQANFAVFHYKYSDLQVNKLVGLAVIVENAANAVVDGAEFELRARPWPGGELRLNGGYLNARFTDYVTTDPVAPQLGNQSFKGYRTPYAPRWNFSGSIDHRVELANDAALLLSTTVSWTDNFFFTPFNNPLAGQDAYADVKARVSYHGAGDRWHIAVWGTNLTDNLVRAGGDISGSLVGFPSRGTYTDPRRFGVEFGFKM